MEETTHHLQEEQAGGGLGQDLLNVGAWIEDDADLFIFVEAIEEGHLFSARRIGVGGPANDGVLVPLRGIVGIDLQTPAIEGEPPAEDQNEDGDGNGEIAQEMDLLDGEKGEKSLGKNSGVVNVVWRRGLG